MPSAVKISDTPGQIRIVEIFRQFKAHHPSHSNSHQGIPIKVKVNLHGVGHRSHPGIGRCDAFKACLLHIKPQNADPVCQKNLKGHSHGKGHQAALDGSGVTPAGNVRVVLRAPLFGSDEISKLSGKLSIAY